MSNAEKVNNILGSSRPFDRTAVRSSGLFDWFESPFEHPFDRPAGSIGWFLQVDCFFL
ncbi:hypothetical protein HanPI659440_Chr09g0317831 [Helianthus annuus]|nr:hypothetical protein HanPI659440_Chr09g0317831 [Helianthus annuus]